VVDEPADPDALSQAMQKALAMPKGFVSPAPSLDEWLKKTLAVIQGNAVKTAITDHCAMNYFARL
jgi:hypothetical protein